MPHRVRDTRYPPSLSGLTRQPILFERVLRREMDTRVKPAYDQLKRTKRNAERATNESRCVRNRVVRGHPAGNAGALLAGGQTPHLRNPARPSRRSQATD